LVAFTLAAAAFFGLVLAPPLRPVQAAQVSGWPQVGQMGSGMRQLGEAGRIPGGGLSEERIDLGQVRLGDAANLPAPRAALARMQDPERERQPTRGRGEHRAVPVAGATRGSRATATARTLPSLFIATPPSRNHWDFGRPVQETTGGAVRFPRHGRDSLRKVVSVLTGGNRG